MGSWLVLLAGSSACGLTKRAPPPGAPIAGAPGDAGAPGEGGHGGADPNGTGQSGAEAENAGEANVGGNLEGGGGAGPVAGGGAGGESGGAMIMPSCEDANPCTDDSVVDGQCRYAPRSDGTACDDGDFCTLGDICAAGSCAAGAESSGPVEALGRLPGFGSQGVIGTGTGRYLFYEATNDRVRLSLVELEGDTSTVLDHETIATFSFRDTQHASVPAAALGDGLIALGAMYSANLVLLDVAGERIEVLSEIELPWAVQSPQPRSFARLGTQLWVCATTSIFGDSLYQVDISNPSSPSVVAEHEVPGCDSMAASNDGDTLYVNTTSGVYPLDMSHVDDDGTFDVGEVMAPSAELTISGPYLMLREAAQVRVLHEAGRSEAFTLSVATRGASLTGKRLFLQGERAGDGEIHSFLSVYDIAGDAPVLLDEAIVASDDAVPAWASGLSLRLAADGEHAIHYQTKRVYRLVSDELREMMVAGLGSLEYVAFDGRQALSLEPTRTQAFDVSDPASPTTVASQNYHNEHLYHGTPVLYESLTPQQIHFGFGDEPTTDQIEVPTSSFDSVTLQRRSLDADLDEQSSTFEVSASGAINALFEGDMLYQLVRPERGSTLTRLLRFPASQLSADGATLGQPRDVLELEPSLAWLTASDYPTAVFDVDARAQRAAVAVSVHNASARAGFVYWLDLSRSPPAVLDSRELATPPVGLRIHDERLALAMPSAASCCAGSWLAMWERGGAMVSFEGRSDIPERQLSLIGFDGRAAYASATLYDEQDQRVVGLSVVPWEPTATAAFVPMEAEPTSLAATANAVVVGSLNELLTLRPYCGG